MEDIGHIDLNDDRIRGRHDIDRRRRLGKTGKGFAKKEALWDLRQNIPIAPIIFLNDMDRTFEDQPDIGDRISGIKEKLPFL